MMVNKKFINKIGEIFTLIEDNDYNSKISKKTSSTIATIFYIVKHCEVLGLIDRKKFKNGTRHIFLTKRGKQVQNLLREVIMLTKTNEVKR